MKKRFWIGIGILAAVMLICVIAAGISAIVCYEGLTVHEYDVEIDGIEHPFTAVVLTDLHDREFGEGNETLLAWINEEIVKLGEENFFHADYEATLRETYGANADADSLVVEGGVVE